MSKTPRDTERENNPGDQAQAAQPAPNQLLQPSQVESNFGDSSGPLFSIYSKTAEEEDNKNAERWKNDADGILIFTGLFSAAVAALLGVTVQDLRPNSQDTSAFYLGNIYGVLADPNATRASIPSPVAKPPPFSPPRYAVWVNSLWFLSLVMSLSCALWATSLHQWARRYIRVTQPARCSPEKRARIRALFANGVDKMNIPWAVEGLPTLLHLSLFLFFSGLVIFLFNVDQEVFICVVLWIGIFSVVYVLITMLPLIRQDSPYYSPLSILAWFSYTGVRYVILKAVASDDRRFRSLATWHRYCYLRNRYRGWMLGGMEKKAEEMAEERSSKIDIDILHWTISALGDDDSLEKFIEALPGFFNSKLVKDLREDLPNDLSIRLRDAMDGFLDRTLSSNSVIDSVKFHRFDISFNAMKFIHVRHVSPILIKYSLKHLDQVPKTVDIWRTLEPWWTGNDYSGTCSMAQWPRVAAGHTARKIVDKVLPTVRERDDRWVKLAARELGIPEPDLRDIATHDFDSGSLEILMILIRRPHSLGGLISQGILEAFTFDIRNTRSGLQHDFCALWNELVRDAKYKYHILREIRHHYIALHQGTHAAPTAFSLSTDPYHPSLFEPSSYPFCDIPTHRPAHLPLPPLHTQPAHSPDASPRHFTSGRGTISGKVKSAGIVTGPLSSSALMTAWERGYNSWAPAAASPAFPGYTSPRLTDAPPLGAVAAVLKDIPPAATLFHPLKGTTQRPTLVPVPASTPPVLNKPLESCNAGAASTSNTLLPTSSIPASPPLSRVPPLSNTESRALLRNTAPSRSTGNATLPRLRARGLVNTGSMCFANAVLQLLVRSPPLWDLFRDLGDLKGPHGAGIPETNDVATPLVDATLKFFEEFMFNEVPSPPQDPPQLPQLVAAGRMKEDEETKENVNSDDPFKPIYMYDAMKEKRQLRKLLEGQQQDAEEFSRLYLEALDEELLASTSGHMSATAAPRAEEREASQSGQTIMGKRRFMAESVESPLQRIFGGKFCSTMRGLNKPDTVTTEDWRSLQLDIQHDSVHVIEDALARISHRQPVELGPSGVGDASQQVLVEALPSVLVLHLKRFLYDVATDGIVKINKHVQFAPELEIPFEIMAPVAGKSAEPMRYKLYGVLYHHGKSAGCGHYTVDVLHPHGDSGSGEGWLHIDDEVVSTVRHEDVFESGENERVDDRCVYMLFYCRNVPTQT